MPMSLGAASTSAFRPSVAMSCWPARNRASRRWPQNRRKSQRTRTGKSRVWITQTETTIQVTGPVR